MIINAQLTSGDVGGQLGLFLGANIVTIFEFVDFYLRLLWYNCIAKYFLKSLKRHHNNHRQIQPWSHKFPSDEKSD